MTNNSGASDTKSVIVPVYDASTSDQNDVGHMMYFKESFKHAQPNCKYEFFDDCVSTVGCQWEDDVGCYNLIQ